VAVAVGGVIAFMSQAAESFLMDREAR